MNYRPWQYKASELIEILSNYEEDFHVFRIEYYYINKAIHISGRTPTRRYRDTWTRKGGKFVRRECTREEYQATAKAALESLSAPR